MTILDEAPITTATEPQSKVFMHPARRLALFAEGQKLFNEELFFEAHEVWESLWHSEEGRDKTFLQGLIQVAGHLVHVQKANWSGAQSLGLLARQKFVVPPAQKLYSQLDLTPLISALDYNLKKISEIEFSSPHQAFDAPPPPHEAFVFPKLFE